ncbi:TPA: hypothetical protein N0F65_004412 [Lagenidium giganteum]|uniref:DNA2/NAM7 helicase-like C-terminal domain-containing protein n=1 Tax=Lagenidium giganteum TaxID=4803 RepID=A0AAV2ZNU9_9STRA|nr:TPA: hypothetical protein N0F65_004412 [Lagenidium giganteum]
MEQANATDATCSGCNESSINVSHTCDVCGRRNHVICGVPMAEGYGGHVRCLSCVQTPSVPSASPIVQAFSKSLQLAKAAAQPPQKKVRATQSVSTLAERVKIVKWMEEADTQGTKHLFAATVRNFNRPFVANTTQTSRRSDDGGKTGLRYCSQCHRNASTSPSTIRCVYIKAASGRGRKRSEWVTWLHKKLLEEFVRLSKLGATMTNGLILQAAVEILRNTTSEFNVNTEENGVAILTKITPPWVQRFCERFIIVHRHQSGKLRVTTAKEEAIEKVATHLGEMKRMFERVISGSFDGERRHKLTWSLMHSVPYWERCRGNMEYPGVTIEGQRRCHPLLSKWLQVFYEYPLQHLAKPSSNYLADVSARIEDNDQLANIVEVAIVIDLVLQISRVLRTQVPTSKKSLFIISPYQRQCVLLCRYLAEDQAYHAAYLDVTVHFVVLTSDSCQAKEADITILSMVRNRTMGFLQETSCAVACEFVARARLPVCNRQPTGDGAS